MDRIVRPRKIPQQERAKETVRFILQAANDLIVEDGLENLSTNRIAKAAGVNIASLYQYFPSKEAIVAALIDENVQKMIVVMDAELQEMTDLPIREVTRRWLNTALDFYRNSGGLFPELIKSYSSANPFPGADRIEQQLMEAGRKFALRRIERITASDVHVAVYVGFNAAMLVMSRHLLGPSSYLRDEQVVDGIAEMLARFLEGSDEVQGGSLRER